MQWHHVREHYPNQWVLVEALQARSEAGQRKIEELAVISAFADSVAALHAYARLHHTAPARELYVVHTDREELDITERRWLGIRTGS